MKILIRVIQVITALILLFFSIGVFKESFDYQTEVTVNAPIKEAYAIFTDPALASEWLTGLVSIENVKGEPLTEGSQWKITFEQDGQRFEMLETVTHVTPGKRFAFELDNEMMLVEIDITFESQGEQTIVRSNNIVKGKGILWRSMLPLMKSSMHERAQQDYDKLATIIEKNSGL